MLLDVDKRERMIWELADLVLESPYLRQTDWHRPRKVEVVGSDLRWQYVDQAADDLDASWPHPPSVAPGKGMLDSFLRLGRGSAVPDAEIARFARRWGVLHLCEHGVPHTHPPSSNAPRATLYCEQWAGAPDGVGVEPLEYWRGYARWARAIVNVAAAMHRDQACIPNDRSWSLDRLGSPSANEVVTSPEAPARLTEAVNKWLELAAVRPWARMSEKPSLQLGGVALFGAIALQLLLAVTRNHGLAICDACGAPFLPSRRPACTRNTYCEVCRSEGAAGLQAAARWRERNPGYFEERRRRQREGRTSP